MTNRINDEDAEGVRDPQPPHAQETTMSALVTSVFGTIQDTIDDALCFPEREWDRYDFGEIREPEVFVSKVGSGDNFGWMPSVAYSWDPDDEPDECLSCRPRRRQRVRSCQNKPKGGVRWWGESERRRRS